MKNMSKKPIVYFSVLVILLVVFLLAVFNVGDWLKGNDVPVSSQAIVVLAGPYTRSFYAADLYSAGYAREIYVTRPVREYSLKMLDELGVQMPRVEDIYREVLLKKNVSAKDVHLICDSCLSTVDEAEAVNKIFQSNDCRVLVVTSPFHVKRTQMIFKDIVKQCSFKVLATPYEPFPRKWWTDQDSARNVILELIKIAFYKFGGRFENSVKETEINAKTK
jgi:uncharacterized SAM-binding protein YcdF (DUF218 family)